MVVLCHLYVVVARSVHVLKRSTHVLVLLTCQRSQSLERCLSWLKTS